MDVVEDIRKNGLFNNLIFLSALSLEKAEKLVIIEQEKIELISKVNKLNGPIKFGLKIQNNFA